MWKPGENQFNTFTTDFGISSAQVIDTLTGEDSISGQTRQEKPLKIDKLNSIQSDNKVQEYAKNSNRLANSNESITHNNNSLIPGESNKSSTDTVIEMITPKASEFPLA